MRRPSNSIRKLIASTARRSGSWRRRCPRAGVFEPVIDAYATQQAGSSVGVTVEADACEKLVALARRLGERHRSPRRFLTELGREAAGLREGLPGLIDLARGGMDHLPGRGFRPRFDDRTTGQVRHFAGIAVAVSMFGGGAARWISQHLRHDVVSSADGQLTEAAIAFARSLLHRRMSTRDAAAWIDQALCDPG